jgi:hypothetical protein
MATRKPAVVKSAKEQLAEMMLKTDALRVLAAAEEIESLVASTKVVEEYNKLRKDADGKALKDYVILTAIARAVGAKDVEIKEKKAPSRAKRDPSKPAKPRANKGKTSTT